MDGGEGKGRLPAENIGHHGQAGAGVALGAGMNKYISYWSRQEVDIKILILIT